MQFDFFSIAAATIVLVHIMVIGLDFCGAWAVWTGRLLRGRLPAWQKIYLGVTFLKSLSFLTVSTCPLTSLENHLLSRSAMGRPYNESFIGHYFPWIPIQLDLAATMFLMFSGCVAVLAVAGNQIRQSVNSNNLNSANTISEDFR